MTNYEYYKNLTIVRMAEERIQLKYGGFFTCDENEYYVGDFGYIRTNEKNSFEKAIEKEIEWLNKEHVD